MNRKEQKKMENTTEKNKKRISKKMQRIISENPVCIYNTLLRDIFLNECLDYYMNEDNIQYTEEDICKADEGPSLFHIYINNKHQHVMYLYKQAKGYNFYIKIDYYGEINDIYEEDGSVRSYKLKFEDKSQWFINESETDEFIQITENEYNNYIELNERLYSKMNKNRVSYMCGTSHIARSIAIQQNNNKKNKK